MIPSLVLILLEAVLRALVAAIAVWFVLRILRIENLLAQKAVWGLLLIAALAMPVMMRSKWLPAWAAVKLPTAAWERMTNARQPAASLSAADPRSLGEAQAIPQAATGAEDRLPRPAAEDPEFHAPLSAKSGSLPIAAPTAARPAKKIGRISAGGLLAIVWLLYLGVCATLLLRLLVGLASSLRLWVAAKPVDFPAHAGTPVSGTMRWSPRIASPVNIGSGILLPADYLEWGEEKLRVVLAHERAHIRQRDFYLQLLAGLYVSLTWFSPLGWWLKHKLYELGEAISDRAGVDAAASPSAYAGLLLEFAALPRPTVTGVAMAHSKNLSHRIERLLNDASFHLAFTGGRRALLTALAPVVLIAATAMVRVEAAATPRQADTSQPAVTGQSNPVPAQVDYTGPAQAAQQPETAPQAQPPLPSDSSASQNVAPAPPPPPPPGGAQGSEPAMPPMPPIDVHIPPIPPIDVNIPPIPPIAAMFASAYPGPGSCSGGGDAFAIIGEPGTKARFCGEWGAEGEADVAKARPKAHGPFLLFRHEGKLYIVDDPAIVKQVEDMGNVRELFREQMQAFGKQAREAGEQARDEARKARESASSAKIPAPDLSKEIAELDASVASLKSAQGATVSREQLTEIESKISELQSRVIQAEIGASLDMKEFNAEMGKFGEEQREFGRQMSQLGAEMGRQAQENSGKTHEIIEQSLKDGKARPVN